MDDMALREHKELAEEMRALYSGLCESTTGWERYPAAVLRGWSFEELL
jgi:hypothetical protein